MIFITVSRNKHYYPQPKYHHIFFNEVHTQSESKWKLSFILTKCRNMIQLKYDLHQFLVIKHVQNSTDKYSCIIESFWVIFDRSNLLSFLYIWESHCFTSYQKNQCSNAASILKLKSHFTMLVLANSSIKSS